MIRLESFVEELEKIALSLDDVDAPPGVSLNPRISQAWKLRKSSSWTDIGPDSSPNRAWKPKTKTAEPPPPKGWTSKEWDVHLQREGDKPLDQYVKDKHLGSYTKEKKATTILRPEYIKWKKEIEAKKGRPLTVQEKDELLYTNPTPPWEKKAFKLQGHMDVEGIPVSIENRKGSVRKGKDADGKPWRTKMIHPYGFIDGTKGKDKEEVDAYVGPDKDATKAFVVHQKDKDTGKYDEDKVMLRFKNKLKAKKAFLAHYNSPKFLGPISTVTLDRLKELIASKKQLVKIAAGTMPFSSDSSYQKKVNRRFGKLMLSLEVHGRDAGTSHKRISVPKRVMSEDDLKGQLGFKPSLTGIPEAGQSKFKSLRHQSGAHAHDHGENWVMHKDRHDPASLKHVVTEGVPALGQYLKGRIKSAPGMRERVESAMPDEYKRKIRRWAELKKSAAAKTKKLTTMQRIRKIGPGLGGLVGAGVGAALGRRRGKLLKGALMGLGTGATVGWTPDIAASAKEAIKGRA